MAFGVALLLATPALAAAMDATAYRATLRDIDALQGETLAAADALAKGMAREDALALAAHMWERLDWLRATMTAASIPDTGTLRAKGAPPYARCLVWRVGGMEDHVQDVATNASLAARGAEDFIPLDRDEIEGEGLRKGCPR